MVSLIAALSLLCGFCPAMWALAFLYTYIQTGRQYVLHTHTYVPPSSHCSTDLLYHWERTSTAYSEPYRQTDMLKWWTVEQLRVMMKYVCIRTLCRGDQLQGQVCLSLTTNQIPTYIALRAWSQDTLATLHHPLMHACTHIE